MKTEDLGRSRFLNLLLKPAGWAMESRLRHVFQDPVKILKGANIQPGQTILEVGSGTGFFTIPAARMIGEQGRLIAMDPLSAYADHLTRKLQSSGLQNVDVVKRDALETELDSASIDKVLLFGVIPFPSLPLNRLLPEMYRVLKPDGSLAVWLFPISGLVPASILRSGFFSYQNKRSGVYNYRPNRDEN